MKLIKIKPISSLHLGERENICESTLFYIHSDTLFSAFCYSYLLLYGEKKLNELLNKFLESPPFLITSAFPFWNDKLFFPIPLNQIPKEKEIKKIEFIEKEGFEKLLIGKNINEIYSQYKTIPYKNQEGKREKPYEIITNPRIGLSRLSNSPGENYFHFSEVFYKEGTGLFFIVDFKEDMEKEFIATCRLMGHEGIGGDRTVGKGLFKLEGVYDIKFNQPQDTEYQINLSLYLPQENEISDIKEGYYEIIERKGYIFSPYCKSLRRKSLRMFKEGSVFPKEKIGKIEDITPEAFTKHKIYRYGFAFSLSIKLEK